MTIVVGLFSLACSILFSIFSWPPSEMGSTRSFPLKQWVSPSHGHWVFIIYLYLRQLSMLNASSFLGRIIPGALAPSLGLFNLIVFFVVSSGVVVLCMMLIKDVVGTVFIAMSFGFFSGAAISLTPSIMGLIHFLWQLTPRANAPASCTLEKYAWVWG